MDDCGQEGFYDAMLFLTIISVASCMVLTSAATLMGPDDAAARERALDYARQSLDSLLSSTLAEAFYTDGGGNRIDMGNNTTVEGFLLTETYLIVNGWREDAFHECNMRIERTARGLITGAYRVSLETGIFAAGVLEEAVALGDDRPSPGYSAVSDYSLHGASVRIGLTLWWA